MAMQRNVTYASREECLRENARVVNMWVDRESGRIACTVIIPIPQRVEKKKNK